MSQNEDSSDWSIEIFDGICAPLKCTDSIKQSSKPAAFLNVKKSKPSHPFFSGTSSTRGVSFERNVLGVEKCPKGASLDDPARKRKTATPNGNPVVEKQDTPSSYLGKGDPSLPVYSFMDSGAAVVYTQNENEANELVQSLQSPLGFDLEWRVMWQVGAQERRTALVQLCDKHTILLIQVSSMKRFPQKVMEVIESKGIVKTGANIMNDGEKLYRDFGIHARGLVELGAMANKADKKFASMYNREIVSLAKMVATYLGKTLLKGKVRTSNWEAELNPRMVEYAANDCHSALLVYDKLLDIAAQCGKDLLSASYSCEVNPRSIKLQEKDTPPVSERSSAFAQKPLPEYCIPEPPRPQYLRAYHLWHKQRMPLDKMCMALRINGRLEPLKESTVISYVIGALQADASLPFDMDRLRELVQMEAGSWQRHRRWILSKEGTMNVISQRR